MVGGRDLVGMTEPDPWRQTKSSKATRDSKPSTLTNAAKCASRSVVCLMRCGLVSALSNHALLCDVNVTCSTTPFDLTEAC